ncbi:MAG: ABC transporter permease [Actinomycetota bacterium]|nr:ABC transporter permease [Actinomycetota bacterium]
MNAFLSFTFAGLFTGAAYAIAASGLVLTYTTTRVFNLGHGAIGMVMAFVFWQLTVKDHMPRLVAALLIVLVIAPLMGVVLERMMMRGLGDAPVSVSLVVTIGLFVLLIGIAQQVWPATSGRAPVAPFFGSKAITIGTFRLSYHFLLTIVLSVIVAAGLYVLLNRTRVGTSMRAAVDNRELLALFGANAGRVSRASWAVGSSLASLAGILLVSYVGLDYYQLTFLVINAFAAAMLGRLQSLPLTFLGALILGLGQAYFVGYLPTTTFFNGLQASLPAILLFVVLLFVPQVRLRVGQIKGILSAPVPTARRALEVGVAVIVAAAVIVPMLSQTNIQRGGLALTFALVMLSLVLLTGYGGYLSLAQASFMGIGAAVVAKLNTSSPLAVILAVLITAAVGALVALPVLRLTGLYLALATLAFAFMMDSMVFQANFMFGFNGSLNAKRMSLFGYDFGSSGAYLILIVVVFVIVSLALLVLRRGPIGRLLVAMRDSPAACGTLGLNQRWFRVGLFATSAGIAGLGGALLAGMRETISALDFGALQPGLLLLLIAVACGVTSMSGALLGGMALMLLPVLESQFKSLGGLEFLIIGVGAVSLGRDPNGIANHVFAWGRRARSLVAIRTPSAGAETVDQPVRESEQVVGHGVA